MKSSPSGTERTSVVVRTQGFCHSRTARIRHWASVADPGRCVPGLDDDNPVPPEVEREFLIQTFDERRAVGVEKRHESDRALLRVAAGEGERSCVHELTAKRFVA